MYIGCSEFLARSAISFTPWSTWPLKFLVENILQQNSLCDAASRRCDEPDDEDIREDGWIEGCKLGYRDALAPKTKFYLGRVYFIREQHELQGSQKY